MWISGDPVEHSANTSRVPLSQRSGNARELLVGLLLNRCIGSSETLPKAQRLLGTAKTVDTDLLEPLPAKIPPQQRLCYAFRHVNEREIRLYRDEQGVGVGEFKEVRDARLEEDFRLPGVDGRQRLKGRDLPLCLGIEG